MQGNRRVFPARLAERVDIEPSAFVKLEKNP